MTLPSIPYVEVLGLHTFPKTRLTYIYFNKLKYNILIKQIIKPITKNAMIELKNIQSQLQDRR